MAKVESLDVVAAVKAILETLERVDEADRARALNAVQALIGVPQAAHVPVQPISQQQRQTVAQPSRPLSIVELIRDKSPATNSQRIALFAYYRERVEGLPRFSREDLRGYFAMAKEPPPGNYDRDFSAAAKQGWIHEDGAESYLTSRGLETVEAGFGGKGAPRGRSVADSRKKAKKTKKKSRRS